MVLVGLATFFERDNLSPLDFSTPIVLGQRCFDDRNITL